MHATLRSWPCFGETGHPHSALAILVMVIIKGCDCHIDKVHDWTMRVDRF